LQWATLNGAKALNMDSMLGSFEKGKTPGLFALTDWKATRLL
jgi:cytosine/adenosine deaminase-related metal-dependent hydrolase